MKAKKWLVTLLACVCALFAAAALAACNKGGKDPDDEIVSPGPESGVYYYDAEDGEYFVTLSDGNRFSFAVMGSVLSGKYTLAEEVLTLTFGNTEEQAIVGTLSGETLSLTYRGSDLRFLKKVNRTVHFEVDGGSAVDDVTVLNGKTLQKPADPTRTGYAFVGWYADDAHTTPYLFGTLPVTSDLTLYAQWGEKKPGQAEYTVGFDLGGAAGEYAEVSTVGGKLYSLPTPVWDGHVFDGWWVSMYDKADRLSYRCTAQTVFNEDTTLFAVWKSANAAGLASPDVTIGANTISWQGIAGAVSYTVSVTGPEGFTAVNSTGSDTTVNVNFAAAPAGDYVVSVTANGTGTSASAPTVLYYKNKSLARVSHFNVMADSLLVFDGVENAEHYLITVECGTKGHHHENFDNDTSTNFNFANCALTEEGIEFTVTAVADGFAPSVSREFVYNRVLGAVTGLHVDAETETVVWDAVAGASEYYVDVECANAALSKEHVRVVGKTSFSLKTFPAGDVTVKVVPATKGYNSPAAASVAYHKATIATPEDLHIDGMIVSWSPVEGAASYTVRVNNIELPAQGTECDISGAIGWQKGNDCTISVKAVDANGSSLYSDAVTARYDELYDVLSYSEGVLSWRPVVGAEIYEVAVENEDPIYVEDGSYSAEIAFPHAGVNTVRVRYVMRGQLSEWVSLDINVYTIEFDTRMGNRLDPLYKAQGDKLELPDAVRDGYEFDGWYNAPGGAAGGGAPFTDDHFFGQDSVVYANWKAASFEVSFNFGNGTGESEKQEVTFGSSFKFPEATIDDAKYAFAGWFSLPGGGGTRYTDDHGESVITWNAPSDVTVYAFYAEVLTFTKVEPEGGTAYYSVSGGPQIGQVTQITVPVTYPDGDSVLPVKEVAPYAFSSQRNLFKISLPDTIQDLNEGEAFYMCSYLEEVELYAVPTDQRPAGCEVVEYYSDDGVVIRNLEATGKVEVAFFPLGKTGEYKIPAGVEVIRQKVFSGAKISEITIPNTVTEIQQNAFIYCDRLVAVNFEAKSGSEGSDVSIVIHKGAFAQCSSLYGLELPAHFALDADAADGIGDIINGCSKLAYLEVADGNDTFGSIDGVLTNEDKSVIIYVPKARSGRYTVPEGVKEIEAEAFKRCTKLTDIVIPNFVTVIGNNAFEGCTGVRTVLFEGNAPANVALTIGENAFSGNTNIRSVTFEAGSPVTVIGANAFSGLRLITEISLPQRLTDVEDSAFANCVLLASVSFAADGADLKFGKNVFENCQALTSVHLPANVTEFNASVFAGCENLRKVTVDANSEHFRDEDGVLYNKAGTEILFYAKARTEETPQLLPTLETIGEGVFSGNNNITSITIGANVKTIAEKAFANCSRLRTITFADGTEELTIGESAFENCPGLTAVNFPERLKAIPDHALYHDVAVLTVTLGGATEIGEGAFYGTGITAVDLSKVEKVGKEAFSGTGLTAIDLTHVTQIGDSAFASTAIGSVTLASGVSIGSGAFKNCTRLETVTIAAGVKEIPAETFSGCTKLASISIPSSVTKIGAGAFAKCAQLKTVEIGGGEDPLELAGDFSTGVFTDCTSLAKIALPARTKTVGKNCFKGCTQLSEVTFAGKDETSNLEVIDNNAFSGTIIESVTIPEKVTAIADSAFANTKLTSLVLPAKLESIGSSAFSGVATLKGTLQIPATVKTIGASAFANTGIETVTFAAAEGADAALELGDKAFQNAAITSASLPKHLTKLGNDVFDGCSALASIDVAEGNTAYSAKDGVLYNSDKTTLLYCPVGKTGTVTVPNTVTLIANKAFYGSKLTKVSFEEYAGTDKPLTIGVNESQYTSSPTHTNVFTDSAITTVELPERTVEILDYAFAESGITSIVIPASLTTINKYAFDGCEALETVTFTEGGKGLQILDYAFRYPHFTAVKFPAHTTSIGANAFTGSYGDDGPLATIEFTDGEGENASKLTSIGSQAFAYSAVTSIVFPSGLTKLTSSMFFECKHLTSVTLPANLKEVGDVSSLFPATVSEINVPETSETYKAQNGVLFDNAMQTLVFYPLGKTEKNYVVPESVVTIGTKAFKGNQVLEAVTISAKVSRIMSSAFEECTKLATVTFTDGVNLKFRDEEPSATNEKGTLAADVFKHCDALKTITIPARVVELGESMFANCGELATVTIDPTTTIIELPDELFYSCAKLTAFAIPATVTKIGSSAFYGCKQITTITIPENVDSIGSQAFNNCSALASVTFAGQKIKDFPSGVFGGCAALNNFTIPSGVTSIGREALKGTGIKSISIPAGVTSIGAYAFENCAELESVSFTGNLLTSVGEYAFHNCTSLEEIELPASVTTVGSNAFQACTSLVSASLPGVTEIPSYLFDGATELADVEFAPDVTKIGSYAFRKAESLATFDFSNSLISIGTAAFNASGITSVFISGTVETIDRQAFLGCADLVKVEMRIGNLGELKDETFADCTSLSDITVPSTVLKIGTNVFRGVPGLEIAPDNPSFSVLDGVLYNADKTTLLSYPATKGGRFEIPDTVTSIMNAAFSGSQIEEVKIPNSIHEIPAHAFENCANLTVVEMHDDVQVIGLNAFSGTAIKSITIGKYTTQIGSYAFQNCTMLTDVNFEPDGIEVLTLGDYAFSGCTALKSIEIPKRVRTLVEIDDSSWYPSADVSHGIGGHTFANDTMLESVTFEETGAVLAGYRLTLGYDAFYGCTALKSITFPEYLGDVEYELSSPYSDPTMESVATFSSTFEKCTSLAEVNFNTDGSMPFTFAGYTFRECTALKSFTFPEGTVSVGESEFMLSGVESVTVPATVTEMGGFARQAESLQTAVVNAKVTKLSGTFNGCTALANVTLPDTIVSIEGSAFNGCKNLKTLQLPASLETIGYNAFCGSGLTELVLPQGLKEIGSSAFENVTSLTKLTIPESVTSVNNGAFKGWTEDQTIEIPFADEAAATAAWGAWIGPYSNNEAQIVYLKAAN